MFLKQSSSAFSALPYLSSFLSLQYLPDSPLSKPSPGKQREHRTGSCGKHNNNAKRNIKDTKRRQHSTMDNQNHMMYHIDITNMTAIHDHQTSDNNDDNDDDLVQIQFPITIVTKDNSSSKHQANPQERTKQNEWNVVDENVILQFFNLSMVADVQGGLVLRFEPLSFNDEACMLLEGGGL